MYKNEEIRIASFDCTLKQERNEVEYLIFPQTIHFVKYIDVLIHELGSSIYFRCP